MSAPTLGVTLRRGADREVVLLLAGELDLVTGQELQRCLEAVETDGDGVTTLRIDMRLVDFMDSTGLRLLLRARGWASEAERRLVLVAPSAAVRRLLEVTCVDHLFEIVTDWRST